MSDDWYRNKEWNAAIESAFEQKLRRARLKQEYLRIQASTLVDGHPEIALKLLDRCFELGDDPYFAEAQETRAKALIKLGRVDESLEAYEAALAWEAVAIENSKSMVQSQAYLDLPLLVATRRLQDHYGRAVEVLLQRQSDLRLPDDYFRWHAAYALIANALGNAATARDQSRRAVEAARVKHSGLRYHPTVGLVSWEYEDLVRRLEGLCSE